MPKSKSVIKSPTPNKKRKSILSPSRSNTPKKEDTKQLKLDCFFPKQKVRKVEEPTKANVIISATTPIRIDNDSGDESDESPVPIKILDNVIMMDELSCESSSSSSGCPAILDCSDEEEIKPSSKVEYHPIVENEPIIEMSQTSNKLSPVNNEDSMDLFNDDCYAQFCKTSESKALDLTFDSLGSYDFEAEKRKLEEDRREMQETLKINKINRELNEQIKQYEEESVKRALVTSQQTPSKKQQLDNIKKMLEEDGVTDMDVSILDSQESSSDFQQIYLYNTLSEEIQRFYIFDIGKGLERSFENDETIESVRQKVEQSDQFSVENYNTISGLVSHELLNEQTAPIDLLFRKFNSSEEFQEILDEFGVNLTKPNQKFEVICPEELVHIYGKLQTNPKTLTMLIKKMFKFQFKKPSDNISVFLITLFICMNRCVPQSIMNFMQGNIFKPQTVQISQPIKEIFDSTLPNYLFHSSIMSDFSSCMKFSLNPSNTNSIVEMLLEKFGFNTVPSLNLDRVNLSSLLQTTKHFFPPCFSRFIQTKPWLNMSMAIRDLFKKMLLIILTQVTQYTSLPKDQILATQGMPECEQLIPLLKHTISFMEKLASNCPVGNNANYACLHMFETILSILNIIFDSPIPKTMSTLEEEFRNECSQFSQSLSEILPIENYRFFSSLLLVPFIDTLFPSKMHISGSGIVQKTLTSFMKK